MRHGIIRSCMIPLVPKSKGLVCVMCKRVLWTKHWECQRDETGNRLGYIPKHRFIDDGPRCFNTILCKHRAEL